MQTSHSADDTPSPSVRDRDQDDESTAHSLCNKLYNEWYEILSRMPAKSAIRYSSVLCKWLGNIHSDTHLIKKQCVHSFGQDHGFFLYQFPYPFDFYRVRNDIEFHVIPGETQSAVGIPRESLDYLPKQGHIFSSSNGLLLLGLQTQKNVEFRSPRSAQTSPLEGLKLMLCNPVTREWAQLNAPEGFEFTVLRNFRPLIQCYPGGHGTDFPNDYTIVVPAKVDRPKPQLQTEFLNHLRSENESRQLLIYCNGRWEEDLCDVSIEGRVVSYDMPVAVFSDATNRLLVHYLCHNNTDGDFQYDEIYLEPYIAVFDIWEKKLAREIKIPEEVWSTDDNRWGGSHQNLWISKWNETSICLLKWFFNGASIGVWVLDNYGCEGESWRMIMSRYTNKFGIDDCVEMLCDFRVVSGGRLLISTERQLYMYVMEEERLEVVLDHSVSFVSDGGGANFTHVTFIPYANTLRPVLVQNTDAHVY